MATGTINLPPTIRKYVGNITTAKRIRAESAGGALLIAYGNATERMGMWIIRWSSSTTAYVKPVLSSSQTTVSASNGVVTIESSANSGHYACLIALSDNNADFLTVE